MCSVTKSNFDQVLPQIKKSIENSVFIAIDCEFSGLVAKSSLKNSLFDSNDARYEKLKQNMQSFIPIQIGISAFSFNANKNSYFADSYTFYILPRGFGGIDSLYLFQSSAVNFLCEFNFDFNKLFYQGISYLNRKREAELRKRLVENTFDQTVKEAVRIDVERILNKEIQAISKWMDTAQLDDIYTVENIPYNPELYFILRQELNLRLRPNVWIFIDDSQLKIKKINATTYKKLQNTELSPEEECLNNALGFSKVFRLLTNSKKPLVGHNLFLDLLIMYNQFENDLPANYTAFKKAINDLFPTIYDTKFLSQELKHVIPKNLWWQSNALSHLYDYFKNQRGRHIVINSPLIELNTGFEITSDNFHDAGWDSYCTGYCFVRMAHIFSGHHYETTVLRPLTSKEHLKIIEKYKNCVNIVRGSTSHIKLDGPDPESQRPPWLYVTSNKSKRIDISEIADLLGKYGSVDVKLFTKNTALVAVASHRTAADILQEFNRHNEFRIMKYNALKHSPVAKMCFWGGALVTGGLFLWMGHKLFNTAQR